MLQALGRWDAGLGLEKCPGLAAGCISFPPARPGKFLPRELMDCELSSRVFQMDGGMWVVRYKARTQTSF